MTGRIRYRSKLGEPRKVSEIILQWLWHWRIEITLAYLTLAATATIVYEVFGR